MIENVADDNEAAARWVARMDAGDWTPSNEDELKVWLAGDPARHGLLLQTQAAWLSLDVQHKEQHAKVTPPRSYGRRWLLALTAGSMAAAAAGAVWFNLPASYSTQSGEIRRMALADGSIVAINTASAIDVRMEKNARRIDLEQGEVWFQVAKNPARPFFVKAGAVTVKAVGTAFSVRRREHGSEVLVTEGVVETWGSDGAHVRLHAGESAFVANSATVRRYVNSAADIDRALAWRSGWINLQGNTLRSALGDFNRYNTRKLVLIDPALAEERLDGVFRVDDIEGFARAVGLTLGVSVDTKHEDEIRIG